MGLSAKGWLALWRWGDLSPDIMSHLQYPSFWKWARAECVPLPLPSIRDDAERDRRQWESRTLWRYLFVKHLESLPEDEQQAFQDGRHPSQSHSFIESVEPVAELLRSEMAARGIAGEVSVARYCDGRTVLEVLVPTWPLDGQWPDDLSFFRGYEALIVIRPPA